MWNLNPACGVVGVFNLQGASWDRSRRRFHIHDAAPAELEGAPPCHALSPAPALGWRFGWAGGHGWAQQHTRMQCLSLP